MGFFRVLEPGLFTTVQDLGRAGCGAFAVPPGGVMDRISARLANSLVGNQPGASLLEMTLTGSSLHFEHDATIAFVGARAHAHIDGVGSRPRDLREGASITVRAGETVRIGALDHGCRVYLSIAGGLRVPNVLSSRSTLPGAGFGGHEGRSLRAGDRLEFDPAPPDAEASLGEHDWSLLREITTRRDIRAVPGAHATLFDDAAGRSFWDSPFSMSSHSDRVGLRLEGPRIVPPLGGRMASEGMMWGAVQVPADGQPIVLMADHPTTGGYPVIACVSTADLPVLGQLRPRDVIRFQQVTLEESRALYKARERRLESGVPRS